MMGTYYDKLQMVNVPGLCEEAGTSFPNVTDKIVHPDHPKDENGRNPVCVYISITFADGVHTTNAHKYT